MLTYLEQGYVLYAMGIICVIGMIGKMIANHVYKSLIKQSDNLVTAKDKTLKQLRSRYETTCRVKDGVKNVPIFVEKVISDYKAMGMRLRRLSNSALHLGLFCFFVGICAGFYGFLESADSKLVLIQISAGTIAAVWMAFFDSITDTAAKKERLRIHLCDYLENTLVIRGGKEIEEGVDFKPSHQGMNDDIFMRKPKEENPANTVAATLAPKEVVPKEVLTKEVPRTDVEALKKSLAQIAASKESGGEKTQTKSKKLSEKEEKLIEEILSEYLS